MTHMVEIAADSTVCHRL